MKLKEKESGTKNSRVSRNDTHSKAAWEPAISAKSPSRGRAQNRKMKGLEKRERWIVSRRGSEKHYAPFYVRDSHLLSFYSSQCCGRLWPGQSLRSSWCCSLWPGRSWLQGLCVYTGTKRGDSETAKTFDWERSPNGDGSRELQVWLSKNSSHALSHACVLWVVSVHWHACAVMCVCTCETVGSVTFQKWEQAWGRFGQTWPYPHCENFTILQHREAFVMGMGRDNPGIGQGVREVFLGDNVPTAKLSTHEHSITFSYLLRCEVLHAPCHLVGAGH